MAKGGKQPGAGRKKGSMNKSTLEKLQVLNEYRQRVYGQADKLLNAQLSLAVGVQYVYRLVPTDKGRMKSILVDDPEEISLAIDSMQMGSVNEALEGSKKYYTITTKEPNVYAIDSMMNRAFGKPKEEEPENTGDDVAKTAAQLPGGVTMNF